MPIALMFFISILAETNRTPFDLAEAESELVAGFMTEHSASVFVFFFLGEYSSLILMSAFFSVFFLGGHHSLNLYTLFIKPIYTENISHSLSYLFEDSSNNIYLNKIDDMKLFASTLASEKLPFNQISNIKDSDAILNHANTFEFNHKDTILNSINTFFDKFEGSFLFGIKTIIVVFFFI